jgi:hypothetical protein
VLVGSIKDNPATDDIVMIPIKLVGILSNPGINCIGRIHVTKGDLQWCMHTLCLTL